MKSLYNETKCFFCGSTNWLETHHIYNGAFKKKSEQYGALITLCHYCHNEPPFGVHHNAERNNWLKADCQRRIMNYYGITKDEFIEIFGKNYLEE